MIPNEKLISFAGKFRIGFESPASNAKSDQQFCRDYLHSMNWKLGLCLLVILVSGLFVSGPWQASSLSIVVLLILWPYLLSGLGTGFSTLAGWLFSALYLLANSEFSNMSIESFQSGLFILAITNVFGMFINYSHRCFAYRLFCRNKSLQQMAMYDDLTGTYNRRQLIELAEREFKRALRHKTNLAVMMIDIDHFKQVNDTYGHLAGDQVLVRMTQELKTHLRTEDIAGRFGGDEFMIILPGTTPEKALDIADRIRHLVNQVGIDCAGEVICFSVSVGISTITSATGSLLELITDADQLLYSAKSSGRNQVRVN